ncbi:hypothetical protein TrLO_g3617 [Triparma laevis f. longispina]|uniref:Uncharacterized protein n=1 Tax=Triparma laevis f. longispina TaxID=1714387 RepID=A0A9W7C6T2_9STRA|nr:hypothetical protein TrLO_g3617 [Triparma laevis f. longispina]
MANTRGSTRGKSLSRGRSPSPAKPRSKKGRAAAAKALPIPAQSSPKTSSTPLRSPSRSKSITTKKSISTKKSTTKKSTAPERKVVDIKKKKAVVGVGDDEQMEPLFSPQIFFFELCSCFMLFFSFPIPGMLFPGQTYHQWAFHFLIVVTNDQLFGGLLSPAVTLCMHLLPSPYGNSKFMTFTRMNSIISAHLLTAVTVYNFSSLIYPSELIFGPSCNSSVNACFMNEVLLSAGLTAWCSLPPLMLFPEGLKKYVASGWLALGVRVMINLDNGLSGASMNALVAGAYWFGGGGGDLGCGGEWEWVKVYVLGAIIGAVLGTAFAGIVKGGLRSVGGGKAKVE